MKFRIYTMNDNGSGMEYHTKEEFFDKLSHMIDDCESNGGSYFDTEVYSDKSCFHIDKEETTEDLFGKRCFNMDEETMAELFGMRIDELAYFSHRKNVSTNE